MRKISGMVGIPEKKVKQILVEHNIQVSSKKGNKYYIEGDSVRIEFNMRDGTVLNGYIDLTDMDKVLIDYKYTWHAHWLRLSKAYYVEATEHLSSEKGKIKNRIERLHIFLLNPDHDSNIVVDHINGNTLDNRRANLRVAQTDTNAMNRTRLNCNNQTGYRNVMFDKRKKKLPYIVQLQVNGKNTKFGAFDTPEEANTLAEELREKYYGEFAGEAKLRKRVI